MIWSFDPVLRAHHNECILNPGYGQLKALSYFDSQEYEHMALTTLLPTKGFVLFSNFSKGMDTSSLPTLQLSIPVLTLKLIFLKIKEKSLRKASVRKKIAIVRICTEIGLKSRLKNSEEVDFLNTLNY